MTSTIRAAGRAGSSRAGRRPSVVPSRAPARRRSTSARRTRPSTRSCPSTRPATCGATAGRVARRTTRRRSPHGGRRPTRWTSWRWLGATVTVRHGRSRAPLPMLGPDALALMALRTPAAPGGGAAAAAAAAGTRFGATGGGRAGDPPAALRMPKARVAYDVFHPRPWGWKVALYLWTKGIGAGAFGLVFLAAALGLAAPEPARPPRGGVHLAGRRRRHDAPAGLGPQATGAVPDDPLSPAVAELADDRGVRPHRVQRPPRAVVPRDLARGGRRAAHRARLADRRAGRHGRPVHRLPARPVRGARPVAEPGRHRRAAGPGDDPRRGEPPRRSGS